MTTPADQALHAFAQAVGLDPDQHEALQQLVRAAAAAAATAPWAALETHPSLWGPALAAAPALPPAAAAPQAGAAADTKEGRYVRQVLLGWGGMGEVWRVWDTVTERSLAMKVLHPELGAVLGERFREEALLTARLQHPGIVAVHDLGTLPDGRLFFTMEEIGGDTLAAVIAAVHAASPPDRWGLTAEGVGLRRLIDTLYRVSEAVGFAHVQGIIHLDLKPGNVMLGAFGEVRVVDWGLARLLQQPGAEEPLRGTPAYMAPEQLRGAAPSPASDVFSLGCILFEMLAGQPPYTGTRAELLQRRRAPVPPAPLPAGRPLPADLVQLCQKALADDPAARPADARALAAELGAWLEGTRLRERAQAVVDAAAQLEPRIQALQQEVQQARQAARAQLQRVPPFAPVAAKRPGWQLEDRAAALQLEVEQLTRQKVQLLQAAFTHQPELPEAHQALAAHWRAQHAAAEARGDRSAAAGAAQQLQAHDTTGAHAAYLAGTGAISLACEPPDATIALYRLEEVDRRWEPRHVSDHTAPLVDLPLAHGRWLLEIRALGRAPARLPLHLTRAARWQHQRDPQRPPEPVHLPPADTLGPGECLIPAGIAALGGDPEAYSPLPAQQVWVETFVIQQHPVTNADYLRFLDALVAEGRAEEALQWAPRERAGAPGEPGALLYGRHPDGRFFLQRDADGHLWLPDWPVICIDWRAACAYAAWLAAQTGLPWRLPTEVEWEKAAGGGDGRRFPWGDHLDPTWCCVRRSHPGTPLPAIVTDYPGDVSPYGVRGMAGNVRDWCADLYHPEGRPQPPADPDAPDLQRVVRGGSWFFLDDSARIAGRFGLAQHRGSDNVGVRLVRSL